MPSWKKVLISGSEGSLNSLYVANSVTASIVSASFIGDGSSLTNLNLPTGLVSGSSQLTSSYDLRYAPSGSSVDLSNVVASGSFSGSFQGDGSGLTGISGGGFTWNTTATPLTASINNGYITTDASRVQIALPLDNSRYTVRVTARGDGGWKVLTPSAGGLHFAGDYITGSVQSTHKSDAIEILCIDDLEYQVVSSIGNIEIV